MTTLKVKITIDEDMLGMASANPELHEQFIASKSADKDKMKEELASLHTEELMEKAMTIFPRDEEGYPFMWDYQLKGFFKEAIGAQVFFEKLVLGKRKISISKWNVKRIVDNYIFVRPRKVLLQLPDDGEISEITRPLRAETMKGDRVALATSETVPAGTCLEFEIDIDAPELESLVRNSLDWGEKKGLGQWRNSGAGRFHWEEQK